MPRKAALPALADQNAAPGGIATLDRALSLLTVFTARNPAPTLAQLAEGTQLYKSTVLRMLASLEHAHLVYRLPDGRYSLGAEVERLHQVHAASFSLEAVVMPVLRALVAQTRESAAYYVRQGDQRLCLYRVDSPRPVRDHMRVGDLLPLDRGAGGRVLRAYTGGRGALYARIRREGLVALAGDRVPEIASVAAPVFGPGAELLGSLTLIMPSERLDPGFNKPVLLAAQKLTAVLGGAAPTPP
jgi:DNA-binding IclR family transcriptional regulator